MLRKLAGGDISAMGYISVIGRESFQLYDADIQSNGTRKSMKKNDYRNQALKIFPWVCAKCGRDFSGKKLRELTVHHKDHNYKNNPPDGSNWELLCLYCHDNEHSRNLDAEWLPTQHQDYDTKISTTHTPFTNLDKLLSDKKNSKTG